MDALLNKCFGQLLANTLVLEVRMDCNRVKDCSNLRQAKLAIGKCAHDKAYNLVAIDSHLEDYSYISICGIKQCESPFEVCRSC